MIKVEFSGEKSVEVMSNILDFINSPNVTKVDGPAKNAAADKPKKETPAAPETPKGEVGALTLDQAREKVQTFARENNVAPAKVKEFIGTWSKGKAASLPQIPVAKLAQFLEAFETEFTAY